LAGVTVIINYYMKRKIISIIGVVALLIGSAYGQDRTQSSQFPLKINGYFGVLHPIATLQGGKVTTNFGDTYTVGFPTGINFQRYSGMGFSFEIVPTIKSNRLGSSVSSVAIQPGITFPLKKGWTFVNRVSFETTGRYGITPVISKVIIPGKNHPISCVVPIPVKFGNQQPASVTAAVLFTVAL
jgi:hypothetical protein